jgi:hypothetical protein
MMISAAQPELRTGQPPPEVYFFMHFLQALFNRFAAEQFG